MNQCIAITVPNITYRAGTERAVTNLANILKSLGNTVYIISIASFEGNCPYSLDESIKIIHLGLPFNKHSFVFAFFHYSRILQKLKKYSNELKINYMIGTYHLLNCSLSFLPPRIKTIGCEHFNYEASGKLNNLLKRLFYKKLDSIVLLTERDRRKYSFCKNTYVIPNSLSFRPNGQSSCSNKIMISLGRLTKQKGYDLLIEAIAPIKSELSDWKIILYGDGEDKEKLLQMIDVLQLSEIIELHAPVTNVEEVYKNASIYLSSSRWEGFPMVCLEAQSCGLPCVTFDCPCGPGEIVEDGKTGFVVPLADKEMFANKLLELVSNENLRKQFGEKAAFEVKRYSTENISKLWENLFNSL